MTTTPHLLTQAKQAHRDALFHEHAHLMAKDELAFCLDAMDDDARVAFDEYMGITRGEEI